MNEDQKTHTDSPDAVMLCGLDGANPLGFLAALGTLCVLVEAEGVTPTLTWVACDGTWVPLVRGFGRDKQRVASVLAERLKCPFPVDEERDQERAKAQTTHDEKKKQLKEAIESLKPLKLRGKEKKAAEEKRLNPIREELADLRGKWLTALRASVPSLELSLGKHLNASCTELRETMLLGLENASATDRVALDLLSAFGSDACRQTDSEQMQATPFCFIAGSGHQYFLDTARQLLEKVDVQRLEAALFTPSEPADEKLSMRWSPQEDRRYAVMWSDPGKVDKPKTNWAINLLGYRGLQLVSSAPCFRGLQTTGWRTDSDQAWRWPIWSQELPVDVIRSLLSHELLVGQTPRRDRLSGLGVIAVFESSRIEVGNPPNSKINFAPALQVA